MGATTDRSARVLACLLMVLLSACSGPASPDPDPASAQEPTATLYWLDVTENAVYRASGPDFADADRIVMPTDAAPDGVAVDVGSGRLYWTSMGLRWDGMSLVTDGGTVQRADLDGDDVERIVERGVTLVPKQLQIDEEHGHLYWADREGATLWRADLDGSNPERLVTGHGILELVGVALDVERGHVYFSDRMAKKIYRTSLQMPAGQTASDRTDIELLVAHERAAMPVDLDVDGEARSLYWTDRMLGTVSRAGLDVPAGESPGKRSDVETLVTGLSEPVGLALDLAGDRMYYGTVSGGAVYEATLDGEDQRKVAQSASVTGVEIVHLPTG